MTRMFNKLKELNNCSLTFETRGRMDLALLCYKHRLYVNGWHIHEQLIDNILDIKRDRIVVAFDGEIPIGVIFIRHHRISIYVKERYRRNGIGKALIEHAIFKYSLDRKKLTAGEGVVGAVAFFTKMGIHCDVDDSIAITKEQADAIFAGTLTVNDIRKTLAIT